MNAIVNYYRNKNIKRKEIIHKIKKKVLFFRSLLIFYLVVFTYSLIFISKIKISSSALFLFLLFFVIIISTLFQYKKALKYVIEKEKDE